MRFSTALLCFLFLAPVALAGLVEEGALLEKNVFVNGTLNHSFVLNESSLFTISPSERVGVFTVENPSNEMLEVFVARLEEEQWEVIAPLGNVSPRSSRLLEYNMSFIYAGSIQEDSELAVIAETKTGVIGSSFVVREDWTVYEEELKSSMGLVLLAVPLLGLLLIALAVLMLLIASSTKHFIEEGEAPDEYSLHTLLMPHFRGRPLSEQVADLLINPGFWVVELGATLFLVLLIFISAFDSVPWEIALIDFVVGGFACFVMPFIYLLVAWLMDLYEREPLRFPASLFLWGLFSGFLAFWLNVIADLIASALFGMALGDVGTGIAFLLSALIAAPVFEELSKGFGVLVASGHHEMNDTYDGLLYGFAAGLGFSAIENWFYFTSTNNPVAAGGIAAWAFLMVYRGFFNSLAHGWFTATTGAFIGFFKARKSLKKWSALAFIPGVLLAMLLHGLFNFFAMVDGLVMFFTEIPVFIFNPSSVMILSAVYLLLVVPYALWESKRRMRGARSKRRKRAGT